MGVVEGVVMREVLTHADIQSRVSRMCQLIEADCISKKIGVAEDAELRVFPVPTGGIPVAYLLKSSIPRMELVEDPKQAHIIVDDLIDSGATREKFNGTPFYTLYDKQQEPHLGWLVFPWEGSSSSSIEDNVRRTLQYIGEDPSREGLLETPARVVRSWSELFSGYQTNVEEVFKTFDVKYNELVILQDIEMWSTCEHHMLPFFGRVHVAYIADGKVIGASKLARLVEVYSRRLQIQEQIGTQVVEALMTHLEPKGASCIIEARHLCLAGDSRIQLAYINNRDYPDGVPIIQLVGKKNFPVYCYDKGKGQITVGNITEVWRSGRKKVYKITYEWFLYNQHTKVRYQGSIKVTEDHLLMLRKRVRRPYNNKNRIYNDGDYLSIRDGLSVGDSLMPFTCTKASDGYRTLHLNDGSTELEHRFLLRKKLGREELLSNEVSHHGNEDHEDNSYDNLVYIESRGEHSRQHQEGKRNPNKSHPAWNQKKRKKLTCQNCGSEFTVLFAYQEETRKFCSHPCYIEARFVNHKIIAIEQMGEEDVFDLEVDTHHNFAVNGIIAHNCMSARGISKQHSVMKTSAMRGIFLEDSPGGIAARAELMSLLR